MHLVVSRRLALLPVVALLAACDGPMGHLTARATDGWTQTCQLAAGAQLRTARRHGLGGVVIDLASVSFGTVKLHTTNAAVTLTLPETAKADLSASVTNGGISVGECQGLDVAEKSRRHFEARLNGGGPSVELQTTNGGIRIRPRNSVADTDKDDRKNH